MEFSTTLLREKFLICGGEPGAKPIVAVSNRMAVPLFDPQGKPLETFIVRAQTMHACIRMAARIVQTYLRSGPISARSETFDFAGAWESICDEHETRFNPSRWVAVYSNGKPVFSSGDRHMFVDVVEKFDSRNHGNYDEAVIFAEKALSTPERKITITHEGNIGLVATVRKGYAKCGLILRNPNRRTTFNFIAEDKEGHSVSIVQSLNVAAAFLEGIQIAFQIGMANEKLRVGRIEKYGIEDRRADSARRRLGHVNVEIRGYENALNVRYRPEKPDFPQVVIDAEQFTRDLLKSQASLEPAITSPLPQTAE